jgi:Concanavalin A-like lectin/glucanases superfamily
MPVISVTGKTNIVIAVTGKTNYYPIPAVLLPGPKNFDWLSYQPSTDLSLYFSPRRVSAPSQQPKTYVRPGQIAVLSDDSDVWYRSRRIGLLGPQVPTGFTITPGNGVNVITMTALSPTIAVHRSIAGANSYGSQSTFSAGSLPYVDSTTVAGISYDYQFAGIANGQQSPWSPTITTYSLVYDSFQTTGSFLTGQLDNLGNPALVVGGATWTVASAGNLTETATASLHYGVVWNTGSLDFSGTLTFIWPSGNVPFAMGFKVRYNIANGDFVWVYIENTGSGPFASIYLVGTATGQLAGPVSVSSYTLGIAHTVNAQVSGSTITILIDGTSVLVGTGINYPMSTWHGIDTYRDPGNYVAVVVNDIELRTFWPPLSPFSAAQYRSPFGAFRYPTNPTLPLGGTSYTLISTDSVWRGPANIIDGVAYTMFGCFSNEEFTPEYIALASTTDITTFGLNSKWIPLGVCITTGSNTNFGGYEEQQCVMFPAPAVFGLGPNGAVDYTSAQNEAGTAEQIVTLKMTDLTDYTTCTFDRVLVPFDGTYSYRTPWVYNVGGVQNFNIICCKVSGTGGLGSGVGFIVVASLGTGLTVGPFSVVLPAANLYYEAGQTGVASRYAPALVVDVASPAGGNSQGTYEMEFTTTANRFFDAAAGIQVQSQAISVDGFIFKMSPYPFFMPSGLNTDPGGGESGNLVGVERNGIVFFNEAGSQIPGGNGPGQNLCFSIGNGMGFAAVPKPLTSYGNPPTGLMPTTGAGAAAGKIAWTWTAPSGSPIGYNVQRSWAGFGQWVRVATNVTGTSWTDAQCSANVPYDYQVQAVFAGGGSQWSKPATATASDPAGSSNINYWFKGNQATSDVWLTEPSSNSGAVAGVGDYSQLMAPTPAQQITTALQPTFASSPGAVVFSGSQYLLAQTGVPSSPDPTVSDTTIVITFKASVNNVLQYMISNAFFAETTPFALYNGGFHLGLGVDGKLVFQSGAGTSNAWPDGVSYTGTTSVDTAHYHQVMVVCNHTAGITIFLDGVSIYNSSSVTRIQQGNYLAIGCSGQSLGSNGFNGQILDIQNYPSDVSANVASLLAYSNSLGITLPSPYLIQDNFVAANGTTLQGRTPSPTNVPGNSWIIAPINSASSLFIENDVATGNVFSGFLFNVINTGTPTVTQTFTLTPKNNDPYIYIIGRYSDANNYWEFFFNVAAGTVSLDSLVSGTPTNFGSWTYALTQNTSYAIKVVWSGATVTLYVNGTLVGTYGSMTTNLTATSFGCGVYNNVVPQTTFSSFGIMSP